MIFIKYINIIYTFFKGESLWLEEHAWILISLTREHNTRNLTRQEHNVYWGGGT